MFKNILIATDGTDFSNHAIKTGVEFAASLQAAVVFAHVTQPYSSLPIPSYPFPEKLVPSLEQHLDFCRDSSKTILNAAQEIARAHKVNSRCVSIEFDQPWRGLLQIAQNEQCDAIVMASHGRRGLSGLLLGSETQKVLTHSHLPVLVVR